MFSTPFVKTILKFLGTDLLDHGVTAVYCAENWQISCRDLAKSRTAFAVQGFKADHWEFFEELRVAYKYELRPVMSKLIFVPLDPADPTVQ